MGPCDDDRVAVQATLAWEEEGRRPCAQRGPVAGASGFVWICCLVQVTNPALGIAVLFGSLGAAFPTRTARFLKRSRARRGGRGERHAPSAGGVRAPVAAQRDSNENPTTTCAHTST